MNNNLAFVGAGRMAGAMIRGILKTGAWQPAHIICTGARDGTPESLSKDTGIRFTYDWKDLVQNSGWIVLACKPQQLGELPAGLDDLTEGRRILSILAGTPLTRLREVFPRAVNIVRAMPNTPGMIGAGTTAFSTLNPLDPDEDTTVRSMLSALGEVTAINESLLNAVTGLSGSGPAYVFEFVAALRDGGVTAGLDKETAYRLALKTVKGAVELLEAVPETPETHRDWVSSPGGTTLAGLAIMEEAGFRAILRDTVLAAAKRSEELAGS